MLTDDKLTDFNDLRDRNLIAECIAHAQPVVMLEQPLSEIGPSTALAVAPVGAPAAPSTTQDVIAKTVRYLATLGPVEYDRVRKDEAKRLNLRLATIDNLVAETRQNLYREQADQDGEPDASLTSDSTFAPGIPPDFIVNSEGVFGHSRTGRNEDVVRICATLRVTALVRDIASANWGRVLEFVDADDVPHKWVMPMATLIGDGVELCRELAQQGLNIDPSARARALLVKYIAGCTPNVRGRCVQKTG